MAKDNQKGVSLIIVFFIMIIVLSIILSISVLLYNGLKITRNIGNSVSSYYSAESGIEKVLFYDRQVKPTNEAACTTDDDCQSYGAYNTCDTISGICVASDKRGLCSIVDNCDPSGSAVDDSIFCAGVANDATSSDCDPLSCQSCSVSFTTDLGNDRNYSLISSVNQTSSIYLDVSVVGYYGESSRKINIFSSNP